MNSIISIYILWRLFLSKFTVPEILELHVLEEANSYSKLIFNLSLLPTNKTNRLSEYICKVYIHLLVHDELPLSILDCMSESRVPENRYVHNKLYFPGFLQSLIVKVMMNSKYHSPSTQIYTINNIYSIRRHLKYTYAHC